MLTPIGHVLQAIANVSLCEILLGGTKILPRGAEVVSGGMVVAMGAMVVVVAMGAMVVVVAMGAMMVVVVTNCVTHRSFSSSLRGARACFMPTPRVRVWFCCR